MGVWVATVAVIFTLIVLTGNAVFLLPSAEALCYGPYGAARPYAEAQGENLYLLWEYGSQLNSPPGDHHLQFKRSTDAGESFGETVTLHSSDPRCSIFPRMAVDGDNVYVMWDDQSILFKASNDGGATFGETIVLGGGHLGTIGVPLAYPDGGQVLAGGDRVYTVWNNIGDIVFRKSDDSGKSFSPPVELNLEEESYRPKIASSGSNVYVAWTQDVYHSDQPELVVDKKVLFARSDDYGETFGQPVTLQELQDEEFSDPNPLIAVNGNDVYLLWREDHLNYFLSASTDGGKTFSEKVSISGIRDHLSYIALFAAFDDALNVGWKTEDGHTTILKSTDGGKEFAEVDLSIPQEFFSGPGHVDIREGGLAYFMWPVYSQEERRISFAAAREGSEEPSVPVPLLENEYVPETEPPSIPTMAASGDIVHVLWLESSGPHSDYHQQILVRTSTDGGKTFGQAVEVSSMVTVPEFGSVALLLVAAAIAGVVVVARRQRIA